MPVFHILVDAISLLHFCSSDRKNRFFFKAFISLITPGAERLLPDVLASVFLSAVSEEFMTSCFSVLLSSRWFIGVPRLMGINLFFFTCKTVDLFLCFE